MTSTQGPGNPTSPAKREDAPASSPDKDQTEA